MIAPGIQEEVLPLDMLRAGEEANIVELTGNASQIHRLAEMGFCPGACIRMVRCGSPCLLALEGKRLSIRLSHDTEVMVAMAASMS